MYQIGEFIIYGNNGVCEVEDIGLLDISGINQKKSYYTLKPIYENGQIFAPVDTNMFTRGLINKDEVEGLIQQIPFLEEIECNDKNVRLLQDCYKKLVDTHECIDLLTIIKNINDKKSKAAKLGKKLGQVDEKYLKIAKTLIDDEFSVVLGIPKKEVDSYIEEKLK
ncbi:MAG: CarD family transcriptional regulator [Terrisporobacter sp.]|uniref:CarD family transcriptional regulator n=1 Tax=Terrisporobacter sp. TaxID=1965305 RepID=UPI002FCB8197